MNYVVFAGGVGMVVGREEWKWWPGLKTTMKDEEVKEVDSFQKATHNFLKKFK